MSELDEFFAPASEVDLYFRSLYGDRELDPEEQGRIAIHPSGHFNEVVYFTSARKAAEWVAEKCVSDVFVCVGLTSCTSRHSRGTEAHILSLPGLYADIDCDPSGFKQSGNGDVKVPRSPAEAAEILATMELQPSLLVHSGTGLHAYWLFDDMLRVEDHEEVRKLTYGWQCEVAKTFEAAGGYKVDSVFDLARVLRAPGFANSKYDGAHTSIYEDRTLERVYHPNHFDKYEKTPPTGGGADAAGDDIDLEITMTPLSDEALEVLNKPSRLNDLWMQKDTAEPAGDTSQSGWDMALMRECIRQGIEDPNELWAILREYRQTHAENPAKAAKGLQRGYAKRTISKASLAEQEFKHRRNDATEDFSVLSNGPWDDPITAADRILRKRPHIVRFRSSFYEWGQSEGYAELPDEEIENIACVCCNELVSEENERRIVIAEADGKKPKLVKTTNSYVRDTIAQLRARVVCPPNNENPAWLRSPLIPVKDAIPVQNGVLDISKRRLLPPTPNFFSVGRSAATYVPNAKCPKWQSFLDASLVGDTGSIKLLQEWFGYVISEDMRHHKMMMLGGASRSGKGTIGRVLSKLVGDSRTITPSLPQLGTPFGLQSFLDARLAFFGDVRHSGSRQNQHVLETLLSLTGGDSLNIDRKFKTPIRNYRVRAKLMLAFNGLPDFRENSAALINRILYIHFPVSFIDRENTNLTSELLSELPGILNWSLDGYERLLANNRFTKVPRVEEHLNLMTVSQCQMKQFLSDCCEVREDLTCLKTEVYKLYLAWAQRTCQRTVYNEVHFYRNLLSEVPNLTSSRPRLADGTRPRVLSGLRLLASPEELDFDS